VAEINIKTSLGFTKSESRYLNDRLDVGGARSKLLEAKLKLSQAQKSFAETPSTSKVYQASADAVKRAQAALDEAKTEVARIEASAKADYQKAFKKISGKKDKSEAKTIDQQIEVITKNIQRFKDSGQSTSELEAQIQDLTDKKNKTGKYAPKVEAGAVVGDQGAKNEPTTDYISLINSAGKYIKDLKPAARRALSENLKRANFYKGPVLDIYTDELVQAYQAALGANQARSILLNEDVSWGQFLQDKIAETAALGLGGAGGPAKPTGTISISTPLEAAAKVEDIFKSELGRLPTPEEREKYAKELIAEEKKTSSVTKATQRKIGGILVTEYTGGIDRDQFLQDKVRKLPEYSNTKAAKRTLTTQDLAKTAMANGLNLQKNFGADIVAGWVKRVENGEDVDVFKNLIRKTAAIGLPDNAAALIEQGLDLDSVYAPYKKSMASILELPENSINLNDPTLRGAITADKAMTIFDFEKQLRRDARWQYTDQAKEEVSSAALRVLRDFGFQG
jgi:hypothetical protein